MDNSNLVKAKITSIEPTICDKAYRKFTKDIAEAFDKLKTHGLLSGTNVLFRISTPKVPYNVLLDTVPKNDRQRFNCNTCRNFINTFGTIGIIDINGKITSVWNLLPKSKDKYINDVVIAMNDIVQKGTTGLPLLNVRTTGVPELNGFYHIHGNVEGLQVPDIVQAEHEFNQGIEAINLNQSEYYRGNTLNKGMEILEASKSHKARNNIASLKRHIEYADALSSLRGRQRDNFIRLFVSTYLVAGNLANSGLRINNSALGMFLDLVKQGKSRAALAAFDEITDVDVYQRTTATPSDNAIEIAEKAIVKEGLANAFARKLASPRDVKHLRLWKRPTDKSIEDSTVFGSIKSSNKRQEPETITAVIPISMKRFMEEVAPTAERIFFRRLILSSCGGLTVPEIAGSGVLFKYGNDVSWFVRHMYAPAETGEFNVQGIYHGPACEFMSGQEYDNIFFHIAYDDLPKAYKESYFSDMNLAIFPELLRTDLHKYRHVIERFSESRKMKVTELSMRCVTTASANNGEIADIHVERNGIIKIYKIALWS